MDFMKKRKTPENICLLTTFFIGFATHLFGIVNAMHNYDDIEVMPFGSGSGITSGRWFLTILDRIFSGLGITYNLPYVNAVVFLVLIAISAKYIVRILEIRHPVSAILCGAVFVAFPAVASTMFFRYTVVIYGIAIVFAVLAVWCVKEYRYGVIPSMFFIACSIGIYQAYVPLTIGLMVIMLLRNTLSRDSDTKQIVIQSLKCVAALLLGIITYFVLLKLCLIVSGLQLDTYQGIDRMGAIELRTLPGLLKRTLFDFISIVLEDYCGISQTPIIRLMILLLGCICVGLIFVLLRAHRKKWDAVVLTALLCCAFPFAVNFIVIMCPTSYIYTIMVYPMVLVFIVPLVLLELLEPLQFPGQLYSVFKKYTIKATILGTLVIVLSYAYLTNINYTQLYYSNQKTINYMNSVIVQVRMTEGFHTSMKWAFVGENFQDPMFHDNWEQVPRFGGNATATTLLNFYSRRSWTRNYLGFEIPFADEEQVAQLEENSIVQNMPCFPNNGSIQIFDDVVVIKLEDIR